MREAVFRTWGDTGQNRMTFSCSWKKRKAHQPFNSWSLLQVYTAQKNKGITTKERKSVHINKICLFSESIYDTQALYFSYLDSPVEESGQDGQVKAMHPDHVTLVEHLHNLINKSSKQENRQSSIKIILNIDISSIPVPATTW